MNELKIKFPVIGNLSDWENPIRPSWFTLGCETLDRDFANYDSYKEYLPELGIPTIRLQAGWAKCEKVKGVYDFSWLDHIIDDALSKGLNILLETGYGNPVYDGGGGFDLAGGFPVSEEGLQGWDHWVSAMAKHFKGRVRDWAMWNEPDLQKDITAEKIIEFNIRTADLIRKEIPDARIAGLSLAGITSWVFKNSAIKLNEMGKNDYFEWIIYHGYCFNPDDATDTGNSYKNLLKKYNIHAMLRQGENGCPSELATKFALGQYPWTEFSQCKWDLRRFIGDVGNGVETTVFTICDFNHIGREINRKGLLYANEKHEVIRKKQAFTAIRNMAAVIDRTIEPTANQVSVIAPEKASFYSFRNTVNENNLIAWWNRSNIPGEREDVDCCDIIMKQPFFRHPVFADFISGRIFEIPEKNIIRMDDYMIFRDMPFADSPLMMLERR